MKNKKLLYILIPAVVFIWGYVVIKIVRQISNNTTITNYQTQIDDFLNEDVKKETFTIVANYKDPFLKQLPQHKTDKKEENIADYRKKTDKPTRLQKRIRWPNVKYTGMVANTKSKEKLALIIIENQNYIFGKGESKQEITLNAIFEDSIHIEYQGVKKTILVTK